MEAELAELRVRAKVGPVLRNFCARRSALIKALTDDFVQFYAQCDPNVDELCLYGDSVERWWVAPPPKFAPPNLPEPASGINLFRDHLPTNDWLNYVAHRSDLWLLSIAFFEGASSGFCKQHREMLYKRIDQLPRVIEVVTIRRNVLGQVQQVFNDFAARSRALTRALTEDSNEFYSQCDPGAGILCLFGDTNELWRVGPPDENVPPDLPQPVRSINLCRDSTPKATWLYWVAQHSHFWLCSLASFEAANKIVLNEADRQQVQDMIEQVPTLYDIVQDYHNF